MKHARSDYDRIQDPAGLIPDDEPVFLIRAQDLAGAETVRFWAQCAAMSGADEQIITRAMQHADLMHAWPKKKTPDMPSQS